MIFEFWYKNQRSSSVSFVRLLSDLYSKIYLNVKDDLQQRPKYGCLFIILQATSRYRPAYRLLAVSAFLHLLCLRYLKFDCKKQSTHRHLSTKR